MKRIKLMNRPTRLTDMRFEEYYDSNTADWQDNKAQRIQVKRWRKLKHQLS